MAHTQTTFLVGLIGAKERIRVTASECLTHREARTIELRSPEDGMVAVFPCEHLLYVIAESAVGSASADESDSSNRT